MTTYDEDVNNYSIQVTCSLPTFMLYSAINEF